MLKYSKNYFGHQFIQNIIFPPNNLKDYKEICMYIKREQFCKDCINTESLKNETDITKIDFENEKFLFNYSTKNNFSPNFESRGILFQYTNNRGSFFLQSIYSSGLYSLNLNYKDKKTLEIMTEFLIHCDRFSDIKAKENINDYKIKYNNKSFCLNNPFYIKIYKFIELIKIKVPLYLYKSSTNEKIILKNFIELFVLKKVPKIIKNIIDQNYFKQLNEIEIFIILSLFEIKGNPIISIKEFFPNFYQSIEKECIKIKNELKPDMDFIKSENEINEFILNFSNLINNNIGSFIKEIKKYSNCYSFIFILERKKNIISKIEDDDEYLEKILYNLNLELESKKKNSIDYYIISLKDFNSISISIIDECIRKRKKISKNNYFIFEDYNEYLLKISSIINFVLKKVYTNEIYDFNIFHSSTFYKDTQNAYSKMEKNINIKKIRNHILEYINKLDLEGKEYFNFYIKNWLNYCINCKDIIEAINDLSKESIAFIKFFKLLKINCEILINFLKIIVDMNIIIFNNYKIKNKIKYICKEEKNSETAYNNLSSSLSKFVIDFKSTIEFSFYFDNESKDFVETVSKINLTHFIINKISSIDSFFCEMSKKKNNKDIIQFYPKKPNKNKENFNFILSSFFPHCKFPIIKYYYDKEFLKLNLIQNNRKIVDKIPEKELPCYSNMICSYITKTLSDILMPNYDDFIYSLNHNLKCAFYNYIYPIIYYNYNLCCVDLNIRYMTPLFPLKYKYKSKSKNMTKQYEYSNFVDFSELIHSINRTKFHENEKINFSIQTKTINFFISEGSTIHYFIDELYNLASYESKVNYQIRKLRIKIKVLDEPNKDSKKAFKIINPFFTEKSKPNIYTKITITHEFNLMKFSNTLDSLFTIKDIKFERVFEKAKDQNYYKFILNIKQNDISQKLKGFSDDELFNLSKYSYFNVERKIPKFINQKFIDLNSYFHIFRNDN